MSNEIAQHTSTNTPTGGRGGCPACQHGTGDYCESCEVLIERDYALADLEQAHTTVAAYLRSKGLESTAAWLEEELARDKALDAAWEGDGEPPAIERWLRRRVRSGHVFPATAEDMGDLPY